jgi:hypothetical protein
MAVLVKYEVFRGYLGAGDGIRTRDQELGKLLLYQLSYARSEEAGIVTQSCGAAIQACPFTSISRAQPNVPGRAGRQSSRLRRSGGVRRT